MINETSWKSPNRNQKKSVLFFAYVLWFLFLLEIFSTLLTLLCINCPFYMNNHIDKVVFVMFVEIFFRWNVKSENIHKKAPHFCFIPGWRSYHFRYLLQNPKLFVMSSFPVITHLTYTCLSPSALHQAQSKNYVHPDI